MPDWQNHLLAWRGGHRKQLSAAQAAGYAALRRSTHGAAGEAVARARAEIALAFAHRWAEIRRAPPALRAAAAAALEAEQAAALSARIRHDLDELRHDHHARQLRLRDGYAADRRAHQRPHAPSQKVPKPGGPTP